MIHKLTKYKSNGVKEKEIISVFVLSQNFGKFKKGEIFEEFYTNPNQYYAISSNLFNEKFKNGHTKIIKSKVVKFAPVSFFKSIKKEDSLLYRLHNTGFDNLRAVEYKVN